jgi:hypothetical protein
VPYTKQGPFSNDTEPPINATRLNAMDDAIDQATDTAENHIADSSAAHAASAISFSPAGAISAATVQAAIVEVASEAGGASPTAAEVSYAGGPAGMSATTVEAAIDELATEKENTGHTHATPNGLAPVGGSTGQVLKKNSATNYDYSWQADATGGGSPASAAVDVTYAGSANLAATNVEAALDELDAEKASATSVSDHLSDTTAAHAASAISYAGGTGMSATEVEAAIDELAIEKLDATHASVTNTRTPTDASVTPAKEATAVSFIEIVADVTALNALVTPKKGKVAFVTSLNAWVGNYGTSVAPTWRYLGPPETMPFSKTSTAAGTFGVPFYTRRAITIVGFYITIGTNITSGTLTVDLLRATTTSGAFTTIYSTAGNRPSMTSTTDKYMAAAAVPDTVDIPAGQLLLPSITTAPTAGAGVGAFLEYMIRPA